MSHLKLTTTSGQPVAESQGPAIRFGRELGSTVLVSGDAAKVVSARHAELRLEHGAWLLADLGSRDGAYPHGRRVSTGPAVKSGDVVRLGESGPEYRVAAITATLEATLAEPDD